MNEYENTDKEIWREIEGEYYSPSIFVTEQGKIGINVGGNVYVQSVEKWHQQADRIVELEKQGEPVAWMEYIQDEEWEVWYTEPTDLPEGHSYKPLYLAPQSKPLSDEEIYALWCEADNTELLPEMRLKDGSINYIITTFAKLIEERHGIK